MVSYRAAGGAEDMLFFVINPDEETRDLAARITANHIGVSVDTIHQPGASRAFFASARYMIAADVLRRRRCPVMVLDIDVGFRQGITGFATAVQLDKRRLGLRVAPWANHPWRRITVNAAWLPPNRIGLTFAEHMRLHLAACFAREGSRDIWWVDQNAAFSAWIETARSDWQNLRVDGLIRLPTLWGDRDAEVRGQAKVAAPP